MTDVRISLGWLRLSCLASLLAVAGTACAPKKEALVLLDVQVADDVPTFQTLRFSVQDRPDVTVRTLDGDPRPNTLHFGFYMAGVTGSVVVVGQAVDMGGCVVGSGQQPVDGVQPGGTTVAVSLAIAAVTSSCTDGGAPPPQDGGGVDRAMDGNRDGGADGSADAGGTLPRGATCMTDGECSLGHCVDGVCCESACTGSCESCGETDQKGYCVAVMGDPRGSRTKCAGAGTPCAGSCGGSNRTECVYPDEQTMCGGPTCKDGMAASSPTCDRAGACRTSTPAACMSGVCADATRCAGGCDQSGVACPSTQFCNGAGACQNKFANGAMCSLDATCMSGNCVDGHCCASTACGSCQACTGANGTCVSVTSADDPDTCTMTRTCNASGVCKTKPGQSCTLSTDCSTGNCVDGHCCTASSCGTCQACTGGGGACVSVAGGDDADTCSGTKTCDNAGVCKAKQGQACAGAGDCITNHCADGFCCESDCTGQCESCGETTTKGSCVVVTGAPRGTVRQQCTGGTGMCAGMCGGASRVACVFPGSNVMCGNPSCTNGVATPAPTCDSNGGCAPGSGTPCSSNQCAASMMMCSGGCNSTTAPCPSTQFCNSAAACQNKNPNGNACGADNECTSGHCIDSRCCGSTSCAACQACTGTNGTCVGITNADDPDSCTGTKTCTAAGACKTKPGNTCTLGSDCTTGNCVDGRCCTATACGSCQACTGCGGTCVAVTSADDADTCTGTKTCDALGACKTKQGQACSVAEDCLSNHCTDKVCCEADCTGQCESCAETNQVGKCVAVAGGPRGVRLPCAGTGTMCGGMCDGVNRAVCSSFPDTNVMCGNPTCVNGIATPAPTCDHQGGCRAGQSTTCMSNLCATGGMVCAGACNNTTAPCPSTQFCNSAGACQTKLGAGAMCTGDGTMCMSGHCIDGRCCGVAACGTCQSCTGASGTCVTVTGMDDPDTCTTAKTCDAGGNCRSKPGQVCSVNTDCSTGSCVDQRCCMVSSCSTCQACTGGGGTCVSVISGDDADTCTGTKTCDMSGACKNKQGQTCAVGTDCVTGFCADQHCCNGVCNQTCQSCNNTAGTCGNVVSADDSDTCTGTRTCNASSACLNKSGQACLANTDCASNHCVDGRCCGVAACGSCQTCTGTNGTCVAVVSADDPDTCTGTMTCDASGTCKARPGQTCTVGTQCLTGNCVDLQCCNMSTCGTCQTCGSGSGSCTSVINADDPDTCAGDRSCDGNGKCAYKVVAISASSVHSCAILQNGQVKCWGSNLFGQLGTGDATNRGDLAGEMGAALPAVGLGTGRTATAISVGGGQSCAILDNGQLKCWGRNNFGQLGLGDVNNRGDNAGEMGDALPAVNIGTGVTAKAVAAGATHTCVLLSNNRVKCWGLNSSGQLGQEDITNRGAAATDMGDNLPSITLGTGRTALAVAAGDSVTCAILDNKSVKCWGFNGDGELGIGSTANQGDNPGEMGDPLPFVSLGTGRTATAIAVSQTRSCALLDNGQLKCWGFNNLGQLGQEDTVTRGDNAGEMGDALLPINLGTGRTVKSFALGVGSHTCALLDNSAIKCWGANGVGQLGQSNTTTRGDNAGEMGDNLVAVDLGPGFVGASVAVGGTYSCARLGNSQIKCWGFNGDGELGLGDKTNRGTAAGQLGSALPVIDLGP